MNQILGPSPLPIAVNFQGWVALARARLREQRSQLLRLPRSGDYWARAQVSGGAPLFRWDSVGRNKKNASRLPSPNSPAASATSDLPIPANEDKSPPQENGVSTVLPTPRRCTSTRAPQRILAVIHPPKRVQKHGQKSKIHVQCRSNSTVSLTPIHSSPYPSSSCLPRKRSFRG